MTATLTPAGTATPVVAGRSRRRWPLVLAAVLVAVLVGGAGYAVFRTPLLGLRTLVISGEGGPVTDSVRQEVAQAADIADGTPLVTISPASVRRRVLLVPEVASASVSRKWPNEVQITIVQRVPLAVTKANGALWLLDTTGDIYRTGGQSGVPAGLLTLDLATPGPHDPSTLAGLAVIAELQPPIKSMVASVSARSAHAITLNLNDGRTVFWGGPDDGARKMQILPAVLGRPGHSYDISDPGFVAVGS